MSPRDIEYNVINMINTALTYIWKLIEEILSSHHKEVFFSIWFFIDMKWSVFTKLTVVIILWCKSNHYAVHLNLIVLRVNYISIKLKKGFLGDSAVKNLLSMPETTVWSLGQEDPLEKKMATHSSILVWEIPRIEDTGRLPSMGSQKSWTWLSD